ncbi:hypothetical protein [Chitinophaga tropicalis]|uniref:DUF1735 domain-containing protein n=1 Tax=Chitinophaga tropicalis TaxID=2683588 RepID=A0A7K1TXN0_9BACT|nr:hypothetical protein [Chitinophaga tropicalis]MVT06859.1 hypothetical protein [Chitinophaga tropicalis]
MKKIINKIVLAAAAVLTFGLTACDKDFTDDLVKDNQPDIPVTFTGATTYGFNPYYTVNINGTGEIKITLEIPGSSAVTIKEVAAVTAGTTAINVASLGAPNYVTAPVSVNGTTYTLTTSLTEYNSKVPASARVTAASITGAFLERAFMFKLTMSDNTEIVPVQCRIRFTKS